MISSGPRSGFLVSTFASVQGLRLAAAGEDLREQAFKRVSDHHGLLLQLPDHAREMVGDLPDCLVCKRLGVSLRLRYGLGVIRPPGRQWRVARAIEDLAPAIPAAWQQPEAVYENNWGSPCRVGLFNLSRFVASDCGGHPFPPAR